MSCASRSWNSDSFPDRPKTPAASSYVSTPPLDTHNHKEINTPSALPANHRKQETYNTSTPTNRNTNLPLPRRVTQHSQPKFLKFASFFQLALNPKRGYHHASYGQKSTFLRMLHAVICSDVQWSDSVGLVVSTANFTRGQWTVTPPPPPRVPENPPSNKSGK